ncbi:HSP20-like chaperone [Mycena floridula]|nr:HSP20-like chaperone [Mycena floridula]
MSIARQLFREFQPFFRMLEEPLGRSPAFAARSRSLFDDPFFTGPTLSRPAVDVTEEGNKYILEADLPGIKKENIEVRIGEGGRAVTIEGKRFSRENEAASTEASAESNQLTVERPFVGQSTFTRTVWLPRPVDSEKVTAKLENGVLSISVSKVEDAGSVLVKVE